MRQDTIMLALVNRIFIPFIEAGKYYRSYCCNSVKEFGLSPKEVDVLIALSINSEADTVKYISEMINASKGMISQSVDTLKQKGLVTVSVDSADHRVRPISLTDQAIPIIKKLNRATHSFAENILHGISADDMMRLEEIMKTIHHNREQMISREFTEEFKK